MNRNDNTIFYYLRTGRVISWGELEDIFSHRIMPEGSIAILNRRQIAEMNGEYVKRIDPPEPKPIVIPESSIIDDSFIKIVNDHHNEMKMKELLETEAELKRMQQEKYTEAQKRKAYEAAKAKSIQGQRVRRAKQQKMIKNRIIANALILVVSTALLYGAINLGSNIKDSYELSNAEEAVGVMLAEGSIHNPSIVSRNTYRTENNDGFWYKNEDIASDILSLPDETFEAILYITYKDMGPYTNNMDDVIYYLNSYTASNPGNNPIAYGRVNGCNSLGDYLVKNGFVDEKGEPSMEKFEEYGKAQIDAHQEYLEQLSEEGRQARS